MFAPGKFILSQIRIPAACSTLEKEIKTESFTACSEKIHSVYSGYTYTVQDEVNEKTISLCINGGKISARILKDALLKILAKLEQGQRKKTQNRIDKNRSSRTAVSKGKQSLEKLMKQNCQLSNIEVTDGNIKSFERYAKKYNIDFSLKKDTSISPPRYFVFFKAKDVDVMTAAFKEYTGSTLEKDKKPSVRKKLEQAKERTAKHRGREKTKQKERGPEH